MKTILAAVALVLGLAAPAYSEVTVGNLRADMTVGGDPKGPVAATFYVKGVMDGLTMARITCNRLLDDKDGVFRVLEQMLPNAKYPDSMMAAIAISRTLECTR